ncbi:Flavodoxin [Pedobacter insulae]|uniref:Flavodoxin n=2 Tax=Pedobacter insulae TaxID=414048 RepID=A0A1I2WYG3_9SPHI|nr:Flavodoxin [Pedobacter insulae]
MVKRKINKKKMLWIVLGLCIVTIAGFAITIVSIDSYQYRRNQKVMKGLLTDNVSSRTLVVFFSRSGNTELMARKITALKQAHLIPIQSKRNNIGVKGWIEALMDARKAEAEISPAKIDLSEYDTIYIGSPIWLYSPAPQVFEFARRNDFMGKKVVLFNSMNSKFEQKYIDDFKSIIEQNGGTFEKHIYIVRGRMTQQMDVDSFLKETEKLLTN